jgi:hypothetical protein
MRFAALLLLAAACGSGAGTVTAASFPAAFAKAVCEVQAQCRAQARYLEQQCEADAASFYAPDLGKAVSAGKVRFDPQQAQACLDGLRARGCDRTPREVDQACERAAAGTLAAGASCNWVFECASGRCDPSSPGACPAKCGAAGGEGAACGTCDLRAGLRCLESLCSAPHTAGQKCSSSADCTLDLYCDASSGKCAARGSAQASCESGEQCAPGLFCDLAANGGLCTKKFAAGASCTAASAEAIGPACFQGSVCRGFTFAKGGATPGTCAAIGEIGASCAASAQVTGCGEGLVCSGGQCADKPVSGPCAQPDDCKEGVAYCDGAQCRLLKTESATCASSLECASRFCEPSLMKCVVKAGACHEP